MYILTTVGPLNKSAHRAVGAGISEKCGTPTLYKKARSLETQHSGTKRIFFVQKSLQPSILPSFAIYFLKIEVH